MVQVLFSIALFLAQWLWAPVAWSQQKEVATGPKHGGSYRRALANNPSTLDPAQLTDTYGHTVANQIFDCLVQYDGTLMIVPAIAQSWKASRDGLTWTFFLRKGVKFHNGREVEADDVVYSFTRLVDPKTRSSAAEIFTKIKGAKEFAEARRKTVEGLRSVDRYTVQIELVEASAPFVASLAIGYAKIVPREVVQEYGPMFGSQPVGTGPFKFVVWKKDERIVLDANQDYYGGRPYVDRLEYRIFTGHQTEQMLASFERGELEDTTVPTAALHRAQTDKRYRFVSRPILGVRFLGFNTTHGVLANRFVRQAFIHAIDREALVQDVYVNRYKAAQAFLPPGTYGYDPDFQPYPYDPKRAESLLAKAGYPGGAGLPVIQVWSNPRSEAIEQEHESIRNYLANAGIRVEFRYHTNWPEFKAMVGAGKLSIFRWGWIADVPEPDNFLYNLFHSRGRTNLTRYQNPVVDGLLDKARAEQVYLKRVELYRQAEKLIMEDAPVIPLNYYSYERLFQPYVQNIEVSALGDPYIPMRKIWLAK